MKDLLGLVAECFARIAGEKYIIGSIRKEDLGLLEGLEHYEILGMGFSHFYDNFYIINFSICHLFIRSTSLENTL